MLSTATGLFLAFDQSDRAAIDAHPGAAPPGPRVTWTTGDEQAYAVELNSVVRFELFGEGDAQRIEQGIAGMLNLRVLSVAPEAVQVALQLSDVDFTTGGQADPTTARDLSTPFLARFAPDGQPLDFEFPTSLGPQLCEQLREVVCTFQVVIPATAGQSWTTREKHASGDYFARYTTDSKGALQKRKTEYAAPSASIAQGKAETTVASFQRADSAARRMVMGRVGGRRG